GAVKNLHKNNPFFSLSNAQPAIDTILDLKVNSTPTSSSDHNLFKLSQFPNDLKTLHCCLKKSCGYFLNFLLRHRFTTCRIYQFSLKIANEIQL
ncbi:hypothetical protein LINPERPRIM_LOCUS11013, partial [Linum perenne]